jgi:DNA-binding CsgD family transcriptional regulator
MIMARASDHYRLTPRELQVLQLLGMGQTCKQIALTLQIAETTVTTYVERMKTRFEVHNCNELIYVTSKLGLI